MAQEDLFVKSALLTWAAYSKRTNAFFSSLTDEELLREIAPGKNRAIYLLGHLTAVHDGILPLLGFGPRQYPQLEEIFITKPDQSVKELPSAAELRTAWTKVNELLDKHFADLPPGEWLNRHTAVSEEDFAREPHRNKFNVLLSRTTHLSYHYGQLVLIGK